MTSTREQILLENPLESYLSKMGIKIHKVGGKGICLCPVHEEKTPSCSVNDNVWHCFGCDAGGSVIDLHSKLNNITIGEAMKQLSKEEQVKEKPKFDEKNIVATYSYVDEEGKEVFQVVRTLPKDFRQRRMVEGKWVYNLTGISRVLYRLNKVKTSRKVWLVEGEKDVESLEKLGIVATTSPGGASAWLDSYGEHLANKEVYLCGDNDSAGESYAKKIIECLKDKTILRRVVLSSAFKDISDFIASWDGDADLEVKQLEIDSRLISDEIPVSSMEENIEAYKAFLNESLENSLDLGKWIPSFNQIRPLVPGELVTFIGSTGIGKTAILQNIAHCTTMTTLIFEMELPETLMVERFIALDRKMPARDVEYHYRTHGTVDWATHPANLTHIYTCGQAGLTVEKIENIILKSELKIGERPKLIMIDYVGLISGKGSSKYEAISFVAEQLKIIAKRTKTIIIASAQAHRKEEGKIEIGLSDGKDSGSIENSSGLVIGAWRPQANEITLRVLKNTKGQSQLTVNCDFDGRTLRIKERTVQPT